MNPTTIVINVTGGCVQEIIADRAINMRIILLDFDCQEECEEGISRVVNIPSEGEAEFSDKFPVNVIPKYVDKVIDAIKEKT